MFLNTLNTQLIEAAALGNTRAVETLLRRGANAKAVGHAPLLAAVQVGCLKTVTLLLEHGAAPNMGVWARAGQSGDPDVLRLLIERVKSDRKPLDHALCHAAYYGKAEAIELLICAGSHVDGIKSHPLSFACITGRIDVAKLLIAHGASLQSSRYQALRSAYANAHFTLGRYLLGLHCEKSLRAIACYPDDRRGMKALRPFLTTEIFNRSAARLLKFVVGPPIEI